MVRPRRAGPPGPRRRPAPAAAPAPPPTPRRRRPRRADRGRWPPSRLVSAPGGPGAGRLRASRHASAAPSSRAARSASPSIAATHARPLSEVTAVGWTPLRWLSRSASASSTAARRGGPSRRSTTHPRSARGRLASPPSAPQGDALLQERLRLARVVLRRAITARLLSQPATTYWKSLSRASARISAPRARYCAYRPSARSTIAWACNPSGSAPASGASRSASSANPRALVVSPARRCTLRSATFAFTQPVGFPQRPAALEALARQPRASSSSPLRRAASRGPPGPGRRCAGRSASSRTHAERGAGGGVATLVGQEAGREQRPGARSARPAGQGERSAVALRPSPSAPRRCQ